MVFSVLFSSSQDAVTPLSLPPLFSPPSPTYYTNPKKGIQTLLVPDMLRRSLLSLVWLGGTASTPSLGTDTRSANGQYINVVAEGMQNRRTAAHFSVNPSRNASLFFPPETRNAVVARSRVGIPKASSSKWNRRLRADIYDELLKLPLRFALHDFSVLQRHLENSLSSRPYLASLHSPREGRQVGVDTPGWDDSGVYEFSSKASGEEREREGEGEEEHRFYAVAGRVSSVGYAPPLGPADPLDVLPFFVHRGSNGQLPGTLRSMHPRNLMPAFVLKIEKSVEGDVFRFEEELMKIFPTKKIFVRSHCIYVYNVGKDGQLVLHHWLLGLGF